VEVVVVAGAGGLAVRPYDVAEGREVVGEVGRVVRDAEAAREQEQAGRREAARQSPEHGRHRRCSPPWGRAQPTPQAEVASPAGYIREGGKGARPGSLREGPSPGWSAHRRCRERPPWRSGTSRNATEGVPYGYFAAVRLCSFS